MLAMTKLPITVVVATKNEAMRVERCLAALDDFQAVIVLDSVSDDGTAELVRGRGAVVRDFVWDGQYPKKRQWCLDHLRDDFVSDWVFFVDADEIVTPALVAELRALDLCGAGYFVRGVYVFEGAPLRYGMSNNKLALVNWRLMEFPVVDDLGLPGMGEIEGHYQPVLKAGVSAGIGQLCEPLLHEACADMEAWVERHRRYAAWERGMDARNAWPAEDNGVRWCVKRMFRAMPAFMRGLIAFVHSYIGKLGVLDGARGLRFARLRAGYYWGR